MTYKIKIKNWEKYQGSKRVKIAHWFCVSNRMMLDNRIRSLTHPEFRVWMYLLCEASWSNADGVTTVVSDLLENDNSIDNSTLKKCLKKLKELQLVEVKDSSSRFIKANHYNDNTEQDNTGHDRKSRQGFSSTKVDSPSDIIFELWNQHRGPLAQAVELTDTRRKKMRARWDDKPDKEYWISVIKQIAMSPFCCGENERGWRADIDFLLLPDAHIRVSEGKYGKIKSRHVQKEYDLQDAR